MAVSPSSYPRRGTTCSCPRSRYRPSRNIVWVVCRRAPRHVVGVLDDNESNRFPADLNGPGAHHTLTVEVTILADEAVHSDGPRAVRQLTPAPYSRAFGEFSEWGI